MPSMACRLTLFDLHRIPARRRARFRRSAAIGNRSQ
jgi:hypothetical protein